MPRSLTSACCFVSALIQGEDSIRFAMASRICVTIFSVSALTAGGKTLRTNTSPSASPRSRLTSPTQRFQRGAIALAPRR